MQAVERGSRASVPVRSVTGSPAASSAERVDVGRLGLRVVHLEQQVDRPAALRAPPGEGRRAGRAGFLRSGTLRASKAKKKRKSSGSTPSASRSRRHRLGSAGRRTGGTQRTVDRGRRRERPPGRSGSAPRPRRRSGRPRRGRAGSAPAPRTSSRSGTGPPARSAGELALDRLHHVGVDVEEAEARRAAPWRSRLRPPRPGAPSAPAVAAVQSAAGGSPPRPSAASVPRHASPTPGGAVAQPMTLTPLEAPRAPAGGPAVGDRLRPRRGVADSCGGTPRARGLPLATRARAQTRWRQRQGARATGRTSASGSWYSRRPEVAYQRASPRRSAPSGSGKARSRSARRRCISSASRGTRGRRRGSWPASAVSQSISSGVEAARVRLPRAETGEDSASRPSRRSCSASCAAAAAEAALQLGGERRVAQLLGAPVLSREPAGEAQARPRSTGAGSSLEVRAAGPRAASASRGRRQGRGVARPAARSQAKKQSRPPVANGSGQRVAFRIDLRAGRAAPPPAPRTPLSKAPYWYGQALRPSRWPSRAQPLGVEPEERRDVGTVGEGEAVLELRDQLRPPEVVAAEVEEAERLAVDPPGAVARGRSAGGRGSSRRRCSPDRAGSRAAAGRPARGPSSAGRRTARARRRAGTRGRGGAPTTRGRAGCAR